MQNLLQNPVNWPRALSDRENLPKILTDNSSLEIGVDFGMQLREGTISAEVSDFIASAPVMGVRALLDAALFANPDPHKLIEKLENSFQSRPWVLNMFLREIGFEPTPEQRRTAPIVIRPPALDDSMGEVAICFQVARNLQRILPAQQKIFLLIPPSVGEWSQRFAPELSPENTICQVEGVFLAFSPYYSGSGPKVNTELKAELEGGLMFDYMSSNSFDLLGYRGARFPLGDVDYPGDSASLSFLGFGAGALGIPSTRHIQVQSQPQWPDRQALLQAVSSSQTNGLDLKVPETSIWSASYLHLGSSLKYHLENLLAYAQQSQQAVINFDFSITGMGPAAARVLPRNLPEGCHVIDLSKGQVLNAELPTSSVTHVLMPRLSAQHFTAFLAACHIPPMIRGASTAFALLNAGASFTVESLYPNMTGLWNGLNYRAQLLGVSLPQPETAYSQPDKFRADFQAVTQAAVARNFLDADQRLCRIVKTILQ